MLYRRSLLSWLGVSVAGALNPVSEASGAQPSTAPGLVAFESFDVVDPHQAPRLHAYLRGAVLPLLDQVHNRPGVCLDAILAPHTPQALMITAFSSFEELLDTRARMASHPSLRQARSDLESARVLGEVRLQLLIGATESLRFPADPQRLQTGVFEVRSYHAPAWHNGPPARLSVMLRRAGIHPIMNAFTTAGEHLPSFTYLIPFESLAARQDAWARLEADPEWVGMQRESVARYGSAAQVTGKAIYKLAPYSRSV